LEGCYKKPLYDTRSLGRNIDCYKKPLYDTRINKFKNEESKLKIMGSRECGTE
jgi:hypothetical protein